MKIVVISSSKTIESEAEIITALFEAGLQTFHLRRRRLSIFRMREFIKAIPPQFHNRIVIHSHHILARKYNLKGIHLSKKHKEKKIKTWLTIQFLKLKNPNLVITTSFNNIGQILDINTPANYSYVFLSPVFDSLSSKYQSGFTEFSLHSAIEKTQHKVVARGGVDLEAIEKANRIGFYGVAFYSSIWKKKEPVVEFVKVLEKFKQLNIPVE